MAMMGPQMMVVAKKVKKKQRKKRVRKARVRRVAVAMEMVLPSKSKLVLQKLSLNLRSNKKSISKIGKTEMKLTITNRNMIQRWPKLK